MRLPGSLYLDSSNFSAVTEVYGNWALGRNKTEEGLTLVGAPGQLLNMGANLISGPLFKPVNWASVFPRPCILLIYLRETLIVFSLQYLVFLFVIYEM